MNLTVNRGDEAKRSAVLVTENLESADRGLCCLRQANPKEAMMRIAGIVLIALLFLTEAHATGSIAYGSRAGMEVTIVGVSGIGTSHAAILVKHTRENAKAFCVEYEQNQTDECVDRALRETRLNDQLEGNCVTGWFTSLYGEQLRFVGEAKHRAEFDPEYVIVRDGQRLDGSSASGYAYDLEQFEALCPARAFGSE
jgi:hypothetical protein